MAATVAHPGGATATATWTRARGHRASTRAVEVLMLMEETSSGNLRLFLPANPDAAVRFTRADIQAIADVFDLLDRWAQEDATVRATGDARSPS